MNHARRLLLAFNPNGVAAAPSWSEEIFSGSQSLTTSYVEADTTTLNPDNYDTALDLEYRWLVTFSSIRHADLADFGEYWTGDSFYQSSLHMVHGGWADEAGMDWFMDTVSTGVTFANPGVTFDGTNGIAGPAFQAGAFTAECVVTRTRTGVVEAIMGQWGASSLYQGWLVYTDASNKLTLGLYDTTNAFRSGTSATSITGGPNNVAVVGTGSATALYLNGTREVNLAFAPSQRKSAQTALVLGADATGANLFQGTIFQYRHSNTNLYSGASYTPPVGYMTAGENTIGLWTFQADAPSSTRTAATGWMPFPAASTAASLRGRNRTAARGTLTNITLQVRAVS